MAVVYITIGNSDDKLSQAQWADFVTAMDVAVGRAAALPFGRLHGAWTSGNHQPWQNACWCLELPADERFAAVLRVRLGQLARRYGQDSIAWVAGDTEFIGPGDGGP